jgi:hypothetical protein
MDGKYGEASGRWRLRELQHTCRESVGFFVISVYSENNTSINFSNFNFTHLVQNIGGCGVALVVSVTSCPPHFKGILGTWDVFLT